MKSKTHYINREASLFEEFIGRALKEQNVLIEKNENFADFYLPNGLPGYVKESCYLEVKYSTNIDMCLMYAKKTLDNHNVKLIVVSFCKDFGNNTISNKVLFLGIDYIETLVESSPKAWWSFLSGCSDAPNIQIDYENKCLVLEEVPLGNLLIRKSARLKLDNIEELSNLNAESFNEERKRKRTSIIIGNGVSIPFGSDSWNSLSDYLFDYLSPLYLDNPSLVKKAIGDSNFSCAALAKYLIDPNRYFYAIHNCIYRKYEQKMHVSGTLLNEIVKSKINHPNLNVITYNYDSFFEKEYERLTGNPIQSVCSSSKDARTKEPKIKHVHGYIPYGAPSSASGVVLTQDDYYRVYRGNNWVVSSQKEALSGLTLFVGSSMSDIFQLKLLDEVRESFYKNKDNEGKIWKCYALLCFKGMESKDIASMYQYYAKKNIYIIYVDDFSKLADKYKSLFC